VDFSIGFATALLLAADEGAGPGGSMVSMLTLLLPLVFIFYFIIMRPQMKEQKKRREMLGNLKKNDRVITAGGIYGVVTNVHLEADEITVKVDEATNTKIRVRMTAIERVLDDKAADSASATS
jgi:preprotein translocase subunit YajC